MTESAKTKEEGRSIPVGIGTAILLFGFILQFFSVRQSLPIEIQIVSAVFVGVTAFLFLVWAWNPPIARFLKERRTAGREERISRENLGAFQSLIERLQAFARGITDSPIYPLSNLKSQGEFSSMPDFHPWLSYLQNINTQFSQLLSVVEVNRSSFVWAVNTFGNVVNLFNDHINRCVNVARAIEEQKPIPKTLKEDYNTARHTYIRFLDDCSAFIDQLNKQFRATEVTYPGGMGSQSIPAFQPLYAQKPREL